MSPLDVTLIVVGSIITFIVGGWFTFVVTSALFPTTHTSYSGQKTVTADTSWTPGLVFWPLFWVGIPAVLVYRAWVKGMPSKVTLKAIQRFNPQVEKYE